MDDSRQLAPYFIQIPLSLQELYPTDDLQMSGGLGRLPIFPDDVLPTLALPYAFGPNHPRLNRCDDDGSIWVTVKHPSPLPVSGGGGGGGQSLNTVTESGGDGGLGNLPGGIVFGASIGFRSLDPIKWLTLEVQPALNGAAPGAWCEWQCGLSLDGVNPSVQLLSGNFYKDLWTTTKSQAARLTLGPCSIDWHAMGGIPNQACFWIGSDSGQVILSESYVLGT